MVDPTNQYILKNHLTCAARELPLVASEPEYALPNYQEAVDALTEEGMLLQNAEGDAWFAARKQPHRLVNMRTIGESYRIVDHGDNQIGTVSGGQVYGECYKGAIYLHRGRQYEIGDRNPERGQIYAEEVDVAYFTRARTEKDTEILEELRSRPLQGFMARLGRLKVSSQVVGYEKIRVGDQVVLSKHELESPVEHFETIGFWIELDTHFKADLSRHQHHYMGSIHAIEHAMKSLFPLLALCDRTDVGGICYPQHPQLGKGAIFRVRLSPRRHWLGGKGLCPARPPLGHDAVHGRNLRLSARLPLLHPFPHVRRGQRPTRQGRCGPPARRAHGPSDHRAHSRPQPRAQRTRRFLPSGKRRNR